MDFSKNSQANANRPAGQPMGQGMDRPAFQPAGGGNKKMVMIVAGLLLLLLVLGGVAMFALKGTSADMDIKKNQYQALFMSNGQVYFCKLSNLTADYVKCTDIYYLQVQQAVQPAQNQQQQPKVSLAKLGSELHGPEDAMFVNRDQVLFWENLKDDSKVVTAIKENKK